MTSVNFSSIQVTRPKDRTSQILAFVNVSLDNGVQLRDMRLVKSIKPEEDYLLMMPVVVSKNGQRRNIFNPINAETRKEMTDAVAKVYEQAVEQDTNLLVVNFSDDAEAVTREPVFSDFHVNRFPRNNNLKAFVSCIMDDCIALNRISIILNQESMELELVMPHRDNFYNAKGHISYFRMNPDTYKKFYNAALKAYVIA